MEKRMKEQKCCLLQDRSVFTHKEGLPRKVSSGEPAFPRHRQRRNNGERLEPELSQTSQNAARRRCKPFLQ